MGKACSTIDRPRRVRAMDFAVLNSWLDSWITTAHHELTTQLRYKIFCWSITINFISAWFSQRRNRTPISITAAVPRDLTVPCGMHG